MRIELKELKDKIEEWKRYYEISDVGTISRRYFVMNAFDGALTMLGVVIGAYIAGILEPLTIITAAISGSIAMGVSGMSGAYMTEKAERTKELKELQRAMVSNLENGLHHKSHQFATIFASLVSRSFVLNGSCENFWHRRSCMISILTSLQSPRSRMFLPLLFASPALLAGNSTINFRKKYSFDFDATYACSTVGKFRPSS